MDVADGGPPGGPFDLPVWPWRSHKDRTPTGPIPWVVVWAVWHRISPGGTSTCSGMLCQASLSFFFALVAQKPFSEWAGGPGLCQSSPCTEGSTSHVELLAQISKTLFGKDAKLPLPCIVTDTHLEHLEHGLDFSQVDLIRDVKSAGAKNMVTMQRSK